MTGVGAASGSTERGTARVEIRSVNGRSLAVKARFGAAGAGLEAAVEKLIRTRLHRGSITVIMEIDEGQTDGAPSIDIEAARRVLPELRALATELGASGEIPLAEILSVPGVLRRGEEPRSRLSVELSAEVNTLFTAAIDDLIEHRRIEGASLIRAISEQFEVLERLIADARERAPQIIEKHRARLLQRVNEFLESRAKTLADADVIREVALFADRVDVTEELERLDHHMVSVRELLRVGGVFGRRLDFLLQEILRETNTLGSKSPDVATAQVVVEMKLAIEKVKEQAANLE